MFPKRIWIAIIALAAAVLACSTAGESPGIGKPGTLSAAPTATFTPFPSDQQVFFGSHLNRGPLPGNPDAALEITHINWYTSVTDAFYMIGLVRNNTGSVLRSVTITITLRDAQSGFLATDSGYLILGELYPGEEAPFSVLFEDGEPDWKQFEVITDGDPVSEPGATEAFDLLASVGGFNSIGTYVIEGEVAYQGQQPAEYVKVVAAVYDGEGLLIGTGYTYTALDVMQPGNVSPFRINVTGLSGANPADYALIVQGRVIEEDE